MIRSLTFKDKSSALLLDDDRNQLTHLNAGCSAVDRRHRLILLSGCKVDSIRAHKSNEIEKQTPEFKFDETKTVLKIFYQLIECGSPTLGSNLLNGRVRECVRVSGVPESV